MIPIFAFILFLVSFLSGCSPHSLKDFQQEGESLSRNFIVILENIENHEQLALLEPVLRKKFESFADLIIQAREFQEQHPDEVCPELTASSLAVSKQLQEELKRIYQLERGKEVIERAQQEAILKLDVFERSLAKRHPL